MPAAWDPSRGADQKGQPHERDPKSKRPDVKNQ